MSPQETSKNKKKNLIRKLDRLCRKIVLARDKTCVIRKECNGPLQAGHLFSRTHYITRWSLDNIAVQCAKHNLLHNRDQWPFFKWYIKKYGEDKLEKLRSLHYQITKYKDFELQEIYDRLSEDIKEN